MALFVDSAHLADVAQVCATCPVAGVTTNPSLLLAARERGQEAGDLDVLRELLARCEGPIFMQPVAESAEGFRAGAERYIAVAPARVVPKLPMTAAGVEAVLALRRAGARVAFTAVYSPAQAYCAAVADAGWLIPYFSRLRHAGIDPCQRIAEMASVLASQHAPPRILAASVKSAEDVVEAALAGAHDISASPEVIRALVEHPLTLAAAARFAEDWERLRVPPS